MLELENNYLCSCLVTACNYSRALMLLNYHIHRKLANENHGCCAHDQHQSWNFQRIARCCYHVNNVMSMKRLLMAMETALECLCHAMLATMALLQREVQYLMPYDDYLICLICALLVQQSTMAVFVVALMLDMAFLSSAHSSLACHSIDYSIVQCYSLETPIECAIVPIVVNK